MSKRASWMSSSAQCALAKAHERVANARNDYQHKLSRRLIDENQAVVVETLKAKNMMQNLKLSKAIGDASWCSLLKKLEYKAEREGKRVIKIDQWFASTKTCSRCLKKNDGLTLHDRRWRCVCGADHDRDVNAAINIRQQGIYTLKAAGLSVSANGGLRKTDRVSAVA